MTLRQAVDMCYVHFSHKGISLQQWADRARLHHTTIERIADGRTQWPRFDTVLRMATSIGLTLEVRYAQQRKTA